MNKITDFSETILKMLDYIGVNKNDFAKTLGYSRSQSIYDITNGKSKPSFDFFSRLYNSEYSDIFNPHWLFTGEGEMLLSNKNRERSLKISEPSLIYKTKSSFVSLVSQKEVKRWLIKKSKLSSTVNR